MQNVFELANPNNEQGQQNLELLKIETQNEILRRLLAGVAACKQIYNELWQIVWQNPKTLSPQQVFDQLGIHGFSFVLTGLRLLEFLEQSQPGSTVELRGTPAGRQLVAEVGDNRNQVLINSENLPTLLKAYADAQAAKESGTEVPIVNVPTGRVFVVEG
jgi:hypothetical protein